ncbi:uncharacterized protein LOC144749862 [Ciona intestinalis]
MKILLILLAFIAAASALSYGNGYGYNKCYGSYKGYSSGCYSYRKCYVYPKSQVFCYNIPYKKSWCSYKYYEPVLHVYPGCDCGKEGWTEKTVAELEIEMTNLLKESLLKITTEMNNCKVSFVEQLKSCIEQYKLNVKNKLFNYYAYYIQCAKTDEERESLIKKRDDAIKEYNEELDKKRDAVILKCEDDIAAKLKCIADYHTRLVENGVQCLKTRLSKIIEYSTTLTTKCVNYVKNYIACHMSILEQKKSYYRSFLHKVHGSSEWEMVTVEAVIQLYHDQEVAKITALATEYATKLATWKLKLIMNYSCAYRCYMSNGCIQFYKKRYYSTCKRYGCWYKYKTSYCFVRYCLHPFKFCFNPTKYTGLKTCVFPAVVRDGATIIKEHCEKLEKAIVEYETQFGEWKLKWTTYHMEYCTKYDEIIKSRHDWYIQYLRSQYICANNSSELTEEQEAKLAEVQKECDEKRTAAVAAYKLKLAEILLECVTKFGTSIVDYRTKAKSYIQCLGDNFDACLKKRSEDIKAYKEKLEEKAISAKQNLYLSMTKVSIN